MQCFTLSSSELRAFTVNIVAGLADGSSDALTAAVAGRRSLLISTPTVARLYSKMPIAALTAMPGANVQILELSERAKAIEAVLQVCRLAQDLKLDRRSVLVAMGGGVCSDVVGFAASMIRRGIAHIRVPTTLVGQIDAGIGLKTGVNFHTSKNFLGSFHPPEHVLVDPTFLATLPAPELRQGFAEMVKIALVRDLGLFALLEKHGRQLLRSRFRAPVTEADLAIQRSIALMLDELAANPFENRSLERLVDMGHTFSPELESASEFTISHGDAVAIDLALTCALGVELGMIEEVNAIRVHLLLERLGLPTSHELLDVALCKRAIGFAALHRGGRLNLVMPTAIGAADFVRESEFVTDAMLEASLRRLRSWSPADPYSMAATRTQANWVGMMHLST